MAKTRIVVTLECTQGPATRTYSYRVSKKRAYPKLALKKYCPRCRKHTLHKEVK